MLSEQNPFYIGIQSAIDGCDGDDSVPEYKLIFSDTAISRPDLHRGVLNVPTSTTNIGMIMDDVWDDAHTYRNFTVPFNETTTIKSSNPFYDAAAYSIYHINGEGTWHPLICKSDGKKISCLNYYKYKAHVREDGNIVGRDIVLHGGTW